MAGKGKKGAQYTEGEEEERCGVSREMRLMFRIMMEEQLRAEAERAEARRVAEAREAETRRVAEAEKEEEAKEAKRVEEERREKAAQVAAQRLFEQQEALATRQFEQQVALMREQAELGERAAKVHREEQAAQRKRDRAISSIPNFKEGEDIEEFLLTAEKRLGVGGIREEEWIVILSSKLSGKVGLVWQDLCVVSEDYQEVRNRLLKSCGYTAKLAGDLWFGFKAEQVRGLTADQLYHKGVQLLRRLLSPSKVGPEVEFALLRAWVGSVGPKRARAALDSRAVSTAAELIDTLQDHLILEGDRTEGQAAIFKRAGGEGSKDRMSPLTCFKCGKQGHKAVDCWGGENSSYQPAVGSGSSFGSGPGKINCYACGEEGHKSTQCPHKNRIVKTEPNLGKQVKAEPKEVPSKPMRRIWRNQHHDTVLKMKVNSQEAPVLLDSGSSITVVPETMVAHAQRTGERVAIRAFGAKEKLLLPMAEVPFEVGSLSWMEPVALAPVEAGCEQEVVYGLNLLSQRGMDLVLLANKGNPVNVRRLTAWVESKDLCQRERKEAVVVAAVSGRKSREESTGDGKPVEDRPAGGPEPAVNEEAIGGQRSEDGLLEEKEEEYVEALAEELQSREKPMRLRRLTIISNLELEEEEGSKVGGACVGGACVTPAINSGELDSSETAYETASGVVGRTREELEACQFPMVCFCDVCLNSLSNNKSSSLEKGEEPKIQQSRTTGSISIGGDVGSAHIEREEDDVADDIEDEPG